MTSPIIINYSKYLWVLGGTNILLKEIQKLPRDINGNPYISDYVDLGKFIENVNNKGFTVMIIPER